MKIGLGCTTIEPNLRKQELGGLSTYTRYIYKNLLDCKKVSIYPYSFSRFGQHGKQSTLPNGKIFRIPFALSSLLGIGTPLNVYHSIESHVDLFHATDYLIPTFKNVPVVATLHDAAPFRYPQWCNPRFRKAKNLLLSKLAREAQHIIVPSHAMVSEIVQYWRVKEERVTAVLSGVDSAWFEEIEEQERQQTLKQLGINGEFLLFVGSFQPRKNLRNIIKAFLMLPEKIKKQYKLVLVGEIGDFPWEDDHLERAIRELLENNFGVWKPFLEFRQLQILFQSAKLFLFPSVYEGFGLPILEAFASKTPVITSTVFSCPEVALDAAYTVDPYSPRKICEAIMRLLGDDLFCQELISKGVMRAKAMSWEQSGRKTLAVYMKVLGKIG